MQYSSNVKSNQLTLDPHYVLLAGIFVAYFWIKIYSVVLHMLVKYMLIQCGRTPFASHAKSITARKNVI